MTNTYKKLTDGIIIFSVAVSDFEKLDFKNDALAGVRANYFNSNLSKQNDVTEVNFENKQYSLSYFLCKDRTLSWKVSKNNRPYQSLKKETGGIYCVVYYGENGIIYKRQYFDQNHIWLRTEYFDKEYEDRLVCKIFPKLIDGVLTLQKESRQSNNSFKSCVLFPSNKIPKKKCAALVYSNGGMLWYDASYAPEKFSDSINTESSNRTFVFDSKKFDKCNNDENILDIKNIDYLENVAEECVQSDSDNSINENSTEKVYSAYDKIEKILEEAHKTNKDIFGEIISQAADVDIADEQTAFDKADDTANINVIKSVTIDSENVEMKNSKCDDKNDAQTKIAQPLTDIQQNNNIKNVCEESSEDDNYSIKEEKPCNEVIDTLSGKYSYYGNLDDNNLRTGRGRTVMPSGQTAYDGEYLNDMRSGFGVGYYKNGNINYVGSWDRNTRSGAGVGYRMSDGTMHVGRWHNNAPCGYGARFDSNGYLMDVCAYENGVRNGKGVSFDDDGNIIITQWENGEKIDEQIINNG